LIAPRAEHGISRKNMAEEVLKVLYRLHNSGQKAYLVGGAVRDLLLGGRPKDYDVATDARPDEIKKLFVNCRLIGRRFRLAHIVFKGGRVVELSTFRRSPEPPDADGDDAEDRDLLIREDNTWGSAQEDAYRRDFTVNALFYNIADFSVIDYVGGLADLNAGLIRTIGDANIRFREDPVRMIRAVEYAARLEFDLHPEVRKAIQKHRKDLRRASSARMADELLNLLKSGAAEPAFRSMWRLGLLEILHNDLYRALEHGQAEKFFKDLALADARAKKQQPLRDVTLFALLFTPQLDRAVSAMEASKGGRISKGEFLVKVEQSVDQAEPLFQFPNRRRHQIKQAVLAARKMRRRPSKHRGLASVVERAYFLDALELLQLEAGSSDQHHGVLKEWEDLKREAEREGRIIDPEKRSERGRRRGGRAPARGGRRDASRSRDGRRRGARDEARGGRGGRGSGRSDRGRDRTAASGGGKPDRSDERRPSDSGRGSESRTPDSQRRSGRQQGDSSRGSGGRQPDSRRRSGRQQGDSRRESSTRQSDSGRRTAPEPAERQPAESISQEARPAPVPEPAPAPTPTPAPGPQHTTPDTESIRQPSEAPGQESQRTPAPEPAPEPAPVPAPTITPGPTAPADAEITEGAELYAPSSDDDVHGRQRREGKTWKGVAGQRSSTIMNMKDDLDSGRLDVPPKEEIPYVIPGQSVNETSTDWSANVGKLEELASDTTTPDEEKWGRKRKPSERR
jgi:poly(A) polymerase